MFRILYRVTLEDVAENIYTYVMYIYLHKIVLQEWQ